MNEIVLYLPSHLAINAVLFQKVYQAKMSDENKLRDTSINSVNKRHFFNPDIAPETETQGSALLNLSFYSFLMFTVPLGVFFVGKKTFIILCYW